MDDQHETLIISRHYHMGGYNQVYTLFREIQKKK